MQTAKLCLLLLLSGCAASRSSSSPASVSAELEECTDLVRGLMIENVTLESSCSVAGVRAKAEIDKLKIRAETAEKRAELNSWMARWGMPIGGGIMAVLMGAAIGLVEGLKR